MILGLELTVFELRLNLKNLKNQRQTVLSSSAYRSEQREWIAGDRTVLT
jgi:hypothetical protein